jgi:rubredoxin
MPDRARCPNCNALNDVPLTECDVCDWTLDT